MWGGVSKREQQALTLNWPSGKRVAAVTSATWIQLTVKDAIYNVWVPGNNIRYLSP